MTGRAMDDFPTIKARLDELRKIRQIIRETPEGQEPLLPGETLWCHACGARNAADASKSCNGMCQGCD